ncbi:MAG TPA: DHHA1 domain-containing protein, partial [Blastocatellia bacterium]|nr:DHHA1 domain-containing protein [Blastocatellia bacterium]
TREMMLEAGAFDEDAEGIVNHALAVGEVRAVAFFKELSAGVYRVSLRSKGKSNVARVAELFGGGGHRNAAGCRIAGDFEKIKQEVIQGLQTEVGLAPISV